MNTETSLIQIPSRGRGNIRAHSFTDPGSRTREQRNSSVPLEELLLTVEDVAAILKTSVKAVYQMRQRGQLPAPMKIGRSLRWRRDVLLHWLDHKCASSDRSDR